jgi:predicted nucleic acid-binding protein
MTSGGVFLDSAIFIAFLDRYDRFHPAAVDLFSDPPRRCHTSIAAVSETYGWFLHRLGEEAARTLRPFMAEFSWLTLHALDAAHYTAVLHKLERLREHKLTYVDAYVDASALVFLAHLRVRDVRGTDRDLSIEGARVAPTGDESPRRQMT